MAMWAIVPVKPLRYGKSRLAEVLTQDERADLNRRLFRHTLETLLAMSEIEQVLVVSRDQAALAMARELGARTVQESGPLKLNGSLERATQMARQAATQAILIVPADLPLISQADVRVMLEKASDPPVVVIAPDRRREGTNAMLVYPAGIITYEYGPNSFTIHCRKAQQAGARLEIVNDLPSIALDVDLPEDLALVSETLEGHE